MNQITKKPVAELGYRFIDKQYIPKGKDEYYLRDVQNRSGFSFRKLSSSEIRTLVQNGNSSDNWNHFLVTDDFNPNLIKNCSFFGLIRIGRLEPYYLEFNNLRMPVGIYNSTIISCDIGNNVVIDNINFLSHYIIGDEVILVNINEMATSNHSKFGNGVVKEGEEEQVRVWMEVCNENGGRRVLPFNGMVATDAWLWSKFRDDERLMNQFRDFTDKKFDTRRGYYGKIGDRTVIKNCGIIKDVWIGSDAYIKGANKIKNITINSSPEAKSQIGEGCELVNGIIGFGSRIFYGVKAVRFILGANSQLKYGARLINSFLGDNSTISCCEVLNSLIFSAHEQHHNNSFLCAATVLGQSNLAAGATIGSNHNSRAADGEVIAGRGFWPGLCVSLKHNSRFASFTILSKGDYPAELDIPLPFSLVSNDVTNNRLMVMPGYWFQYNMYALARNMHKYASRDKRIDKSQVFEYDFLAPDTVNEMFDALRLMEQCVARSFAQSQKISIEEKDLIGTGKQLLTDRQQEIRNMEILAPGFENSHRKVYLVKVPEAYTIFKKLILYYGISQLLEIAEQKQINSWKKMQQALPKKPERNAWKNAGGQLIPESSVMTLIRNIRSGKISDWDAVHDYYVRKSELYPAEKFRHAYASLLEVLEISPRQFSKKRLIQLLSEAVAINEWITDSIYSSRAKDYSNPFRKMVYETEKEMEEVLGKLEDNEFILSRKQAATSFNDRVTSFIRDLG